MHGVQPNANEMPDDHRADHAGGLGVGLDARFVQQERDLEDPDGVQAEDDQQHAGDLAEDGEPFHQELAEVSGGGAEGHEHEREAEDEEQRGDDAPGASACRPLTPLDTATVPPRAAATGMPRISSSETPEMNDR